MTPNADSVTLIDLARCPKADAGLCRKGGSYMLRATTVAACDCPLIAWQAHCSCGWISTPYAERRDAKDLGRRHLRHWHRPDSHRFRTRLTPDAVPPNDSSGAPR